MTDFYIFRHGDTINSKNFLKRFWVNNNTLLLPILPEATPALKKIGRFLKQVKVDADFCSPFLRCRQSSDIVSEITHHKYRADNHLRELEGNETFPELKHRINDFLLEIKNKNYKTVSICTHGAIIAGLTRLCLEKKFYPFQILCYPNPGNLIIIKSNKIQKINFN